MNRPLFAFLLLFLGGCYSAHEKIEPKVAYTVQDRYLQSLPSPFPPLSEREKEEPWGREYLIGLSFAHALDLYQAITAFKRSEILLASTNLERRSELFYDTLLCYYLGKKYSDVVETFEKSPLQNANARFPAFCDLLVILYDSYLQINDLHRAALILETLRKFYPEAAETLTLYSSLSQGNVESIETLSETYPERSYLRDFLTTYRDQKKSVAKAQFFNAALPGAGYLYIGQGQTALTAFLINGLFIAASWYFFESGNTPAGIIFTSFELGWYFGGIYGAKEEAKAYNERIYERIASPMMTREKLFPVLTLKYAF